MLWSLKLRIIIVTLPGRVKLLGEFDSPAGFSRGRDDRQERLRSHKITHEATAADRPDRRAFHCRGPRQSHQFYRRANAGRAGDALARCLFRICRPRRDRSSSRRERTKRGRPSLKSRYSSWPSAPEGFTVACRARVIHVDGPAITFQVEAHDGVEVIAKGIHRRRVIDVDRFARRIEKKKASRK